MKKNKIFLVVNFIFFGWLACSFHLSAQSLEENFINPPSSTKPKTMMFAMSSNMSKEGMTKDLEAMEKVGIGGFLLFNISQGIPNGPVKYNSDEHHDILKHTAIESERLGLSFGVYNCDGWIASGGPWITPEESMKMVAWSEIIAQGGNENIDLQLPQPTSREGLYKDIAVIAYPSLNSELTDANNKPKVTVSDEKVKVKLITDGRLDENIILEMSGKEKPWILYEYKTPQTIRSILLEYSSRMGLPTLQYSDNGHEFKNAPKLSTVRIGKLKEAVFDNFEPIKAKYFRILFSKNSIELTEAKLFSTTFYDNVYGRTSMKRTEDKDLLTMRTPESSMIIDKSAILDLTSSMDASGVLKTKLPQGNWTIMRFGYTSTGAFNWPASDEGRGLECDKFSKAGIEKHYNSFVKRLVENVKADAPNALQFSHIDSYEMGGQNWTDGYENTFQDKKGYDIKKFLPLFAGRFIDDVETTEAVLWDMRTICGDLMTENYYGHFAELCHRDGLLFSVEPYGFGPLNNLDIGGEADITMGEFWMSRPLRMNQIAPAVSASHIYGKEITSAESFTTMPGINWKGNPAMAKITGDKAWAAGINEFMFHRYAHQSNPNVKPGMTMNRWGFHFDRTQTWWENAGADWFKYIARGSYLLRQGVPVSDLLIYVGEGSPNSIFEREDFEPNIPVGTNFDFVNTDVLMNRIKVENDQMVLPEGTTYKMLVLKNCEKLTLKTLKRIDELSKKGVTIVGVKPTELAGYLNSVEDRDIFQEMIDGIWSSPNTYADFNWQSIMENEGLLPDLEILGRDDITFMHRKVDDTDIYFTYNPDSIPRQFEYTFRVHEKIPELWNPMTGETKKIGRFVKNNNLTKAWVTLDAEESAFFVFRESSKGVTSVIEAGNNPFTTEYFLDENNKLVLASSENGVYKATTSTNQKIEVNVDDIIKPIQIKGAWNVEFLKENDYEAVHVFDTLSDWKDNSVDEIKHYSGTAVYRKTFTIEASKIAEDNTYILDLGDVKIVADVTLNGKSVGIDWIPPFQLDITEFLKPGENQLEIGITNQWSNRLIGDERYPVDYTFELEGNFPKKTMPDWFINQEPIPAGKRTTFSTATFYKAGDSLMPSGLLGPVRIIIHKVQGLADK